MKMNEPLEPGDGQAMPSYPLTLKPPVKRGGWMNALNPYDPDKLHREGIQPIRIEESRIRGKTARMLMVAFVLFCVWAVFAPLDSGVNVNGSVVVMGNRKAIQHPTGGVVEAILTKEGATVQPGQVLIRINRLGIEAALNSAELDYINQTVAESRLTSERQDLPSIVWMEELSAFGADPRVAEAKRQQQRLFFSRKEEVAGQKRILQEQIAGLQGQGRELQNVLSARREQLLVMGEEAKNNHALAAEGYVPKSRANEVERMRSDILASMATTMSEVGKTHSSVASTRLQLSQTMAVYHRDIEAQLAEAQKNRQALRAKVESLKFDLGLTELRAPVGGIVVGLKANTVGGVLPAGSTIMEILPNDGTLIVEAQVPPALIDKVAVGLLADMRFSAFNLNTTPVIPGVVKLVGADRLPATSKEQPSEYYLAQIETTREGLTMLGDRRVQAGMPVEVVIKTGERSFMSYLVKPLTDRFARSFKEG